MERQYCIYILTNQNNTVLYTGVTNNLPRRIYEHKTKLVEGFTKRYNVEKLVYYEVFDHIETRYCAKNRSRADRVQRKSL